MRTAVGLGHGPGFSVRWSFCVLAGIVIRLHCPASRARPRCLRAPREGPGRSGTKQKTPRGCERSARGSGRWWSLRGQGVATEAVTADRRACC
ncbi:hypothetical protein KCH_51640 [Kitasatospora cheerisanensis KCTC 2395]|uniref:Uncharacterized protein n=1 Tax=Kitasatospora cheerisanensis KCTC 2395 TaxID=1348663 RepID=A0A066YNE8_9ACTN|nr:hypothetical protein KCH_51640 [Kitasatospora cheerisanensis KCTC 2395]